MDGVNYSLANFFSPLLFHSIQNVILISQTNVITKVTLSLNPILNLVSSLPSAISLVQYPVIKQNIRE